MWTDSIQYKGNFPTGPISNEQGEKDQLKQERLDVYCSCHYLTKYNLSLLKKLGNKNLSHPLPLIIQYEKIKEISVFCSQDGSPKGKMEETVEISTLSLE